MKKEKESIEKYAELSFLSKRKEDLDEISQEEIIYEESQTGPQEEPTLKEIELTLSEYDKKKDLRKR